MSEEYLMKIFLGKIKEYNAGNDYRTHYIIIYNHRMILCIQWGKYGWEKEIYHIDEIMMD